MRYLDWDVLLFPADEHGAHIPVKEFRTACYAEQHDNAQATPLLTTFVPSLQTGRPFQISLHSWSETASMLTASTPAPSAPKPRELWQVKIMIDGTCVNTEKFDIDTTWPQIISATSSSNTGELAGQLRFPPFHRTIMTQSYWNASDTMGRIRIELSCGYVEPKNNRFVRMINLVNFAFQPAPLDLLEQSGIAWPNGHLFVNPLSSNGYINTTIGLTNRAMSTKHKRAATTNNSFPKAAIPLQSAAVPLNPYTQDSNMNYDGSSRSTSAYSNFTDSAAPLLQKMPTIPAYPGSLADGARKHQQQLAWRLPSDQLQKILNAIQPTAQLNGSENAMTAMPPPPLPPHSMVSQGTDVPGQNSLSAFRSVHPALVLGSDVVNFIDKRAESRYSDVSMHAGCNGFPACTSEDDDGQILHSTPSAPATVVRSRKEGASPTKRKLSVSKTKQKKSDHAEKKRRRSSRLLQHDTGHVGDGENNDSTNGDNGDSLKGARPAVIESA